MHLRQTLIPRLSSVLYLSGLALATLGLAIFAKNGSAWATFTTVFLGIFIEALPFLIMGTLASGLVEVFIDQRLIEKFSPRRPLLSALFGAGLGLFFPVCECGVVPLVRRLFRKGLPIPVGIAFLIAAPVINPVVIFSTASAFGFGQILFLRLGLTFLIAVLTGLIFSVVRVPRDILRPTEWITTASVDSHDHDHDHGHDHTPGVLPENSLPAKIRRVLLVTLDELFEMGRFLILGSLIAAAMQAFVPQALLLGVAKGPLLSVLAMMGLAILLSICSTVDSFVALGFVGIFSNASILGFLLYGPMVDIKSTLMFLRVFKARPVFYLVVIPFLLVLLICVSMNYFWTG